MVVEITWTGILAMVSPVALLLGATGALGVTTNKVREMSDQTKGDHDTLIELRTRVTDHDRRLAALEAKK